MNKKNNAAHAYRMPADFHPYRALDSLPGNIKSLRWMLTEGPAMDTPLIDETVHALWGLADSADTLIRQLHEYILAIEDQTTIRLLRSDADFDAHSISQYSSGNFVKEAAASYGPIRH